MMPKKKRKSKKKIEHKSKSKSKISGRQSNIENNQIIIPFGSSSSDESEWRAALKEAFDKGIQHIPYWHEKIWKVIYLLDDYAKSSGAQGAIREAPLPYIIIEKEILINSYKNDSELTKRLLSGQKSHYAVLLGNLAICLKNKKDFSQPLNSFEADFSLDRPPNEQDLPWMYWVIGWKLDLIFPASMFIPYDAELALRRYWLFARTSILDQVKEGSMSNFQAWWRIVKKDLEDHTDKSGYARGPHGTYYRKSVTRMVPANIIDLNVDDIENQDKSDLPKPSQQQARSDSNKKQTKADSHTYFPYALTVKRIGMAFGLEDDRKISKQTWRLLKANDIYCKKDNRQQYRVALDTIKQPALLKAFRKSMENDYSNLDSEIWSELPIN
jgi:hypothetical protein